MPKITLPEMNAADSSAIAAHGYDQETSTLFLTFKSAGDTYRYEGVPGQVYDELVAAESIGRQYRATIAGKYTADRIKAEDLADVDLSEGSQATDTKA